MTRKNFEQLIDLNVASFRDFSLPAAVDLASVRGNVSPESYRQFYSSRSSRNFQPIIDSNRQIFRDVGVFTGKQLHITTIDTPTELESKLEKSHQGGFRVLVDITHSPEGYLERAIGLVPAQDKTWLPVGAIPHTSRVFNEPLTPSEIFDLTSFQSTPDSKKRVRILRLPPERAR